eukprot:TRINITY_DN11384_c0_g1_i1.p1 TRINITY_DN11384_c0_g1~~TRINITY_DN11384_c0_g1_i1.p1  ORF type:complete len:251 (+),score=74.38 TRINITY_DN11384_c0_g1_i1:153-905(+)
MISMMSTTTTVHPCARSCPPLLRPLTSAGADCETQTTLTNDEAPERHQIPAPTSYPPSLLQTLPPPTPRMTEDAALATHFFAPPFHPPPRPLTATSQAVLREVAVSQSSSFSGFSSSDFSSSSSSSLSSSFPPASAVGPSPLSPTLPHPPPSLSSELSSPSSSSFSYIDGDSDPPSSDSEDESIHSLVNSPPPTPALLPPHDSPSRSGSSSSSGPPSDSSESLSHSAEPSPLSSSGSSSYLTLSSFEEDQ